MGYRMSEMFARLKLKMSFWCAIDSQDGFQIGYFIDLRENPLSLHTTTLVSRISTNTTVS